MANPVQAPPYLPFVVKSKANYAARTANEINLVLGQQYIVAQTDGKGHWWQAQADSTHGQGWFPAGFVDVVGPVPSPSNLPPPPIAQPATPVVAQQPNPLPRPQPAVAKPVPQTPNPVQPTPPARATSSLPVSNSSGALPTPPPKSNLPATPANGAAALASALPTPPPRHSGINPQPAVPQPAVQQPIPQPVVAPTPQPVATTPLAAASPASSGIIKKAEPGPRSGEPVPPAKLTKKDPNVDNAVFSLSLQIVDVKDLKGDAKKMNPTAFIFKRNIYQGGDLIGQQLQVSETHKATASPSINELFRINITDPEAEVIIVRIVNGNKFKSTLVLAEREIPLRAAARDFDSPHSQYKWYPFTTRGAPSGGEIQLYLEFFDKNKYQGPTNFQHLRHVGVDPSTGEFDASNIPDEWKQKLKANNVPKGALKNPETRQAVFEALANDTGGVVPTATTKAPPALPEKKQGRAPAPIPQPRGGEPAHPTPTPPTPQPVAQPVAQPGPPAAAMQRGGGPPPPPVGGMKRGGGPPPPPGPMTEKPAAAKPTAAKPPAAVAGGPPQPAAEKPAPGPGPGGLFADISQGNFNLKKASEREAPVSAPTPAAGGAPMSLAETLAAALEKHRLDVAPTGQGGGDEWSDEEWSA